MKKSLAQKLIGYIDLTRLELNDAPDEIDALCKNALTPFGNVAAVCVYPAFIKRAKLALDGTDVRIATVANFPGGDYSLSETLHVINNALQSGADEIDVVLPYKEFLAEKYDWVFDYLQQCREVCANQILKVILETGNLVADDLIAHASRIAIAAGADFLKTSTGKVAVGATPSAAQVMLNVIQANSDKTVGLKISGGVRTLEQAQIYWDLVVNTLGEEWISPRTFRIGASSLMEEILCHMPKN